MPCEATVTLTRGQSTKTLWAKIRTTCFYNAKIRLYYCSSSKTENSLCLIFILRLSIFYRLKGKHAKMDRKLRLIHYLIQMDLFYLFWNTKRLNTISQQNNGIQKGWNYNVRDISTWSRTRTTLDEKMWGYQADGL